jgi:hypothetical protein
MLIYRVGSIQSISILFLFVFVMVHKIVCYSAPGPYRLLYVVAGDMLHFPLDLNCLPGACHCHSDTVLMTGPAGLVSFLGLKVGTE